METKSEKNLKVILNEKYDEHRFRRISKHIPTEIINRVIETANRKGLQIRAMALVVMYDKYVGNTWVNSRYKGILCITKTRENKKYGLSLFMPTLRDRKKLMFAPYSLPYAYIRIADYFYAAKDAEGDIIGYNFADTNEAERFYDKIKKTIKKVEKRQKLESKVARGPDIEVRMDDRVAPSTEAMPQMYNNEESMMIEIEEPRKRSRYTISPKAAAPSFI